MLTLDLSVEKRNWILSLLCFCLASALPAGAQFGGDCFSAGNIREYYLEYGPCKILGEPEVDVAAAKRRMDLLLGVPQSEPERDPFAEATACSPVLPVVSVPVVANPVTRTYPIEGRDPNVLIKIIFFGRNPTLDSVERAVNDLHFRRHTSIQPAPFSYSAEGLSKNQVFRQIQAQERGMQRTLLYHVLSDSTSGANAARGKRLCAEVYSERGDDRILSLLYARAALFERNAQRRHLYLGKAAAYGKQWAVAWENFEKVYAAAPGSIPMIQDVIAVYRKSASRDMERCIWLSRLMKVTQHWGTFESAYYERETVEENCARADEKNEPAKNVFWTARNEPLRVYFSESDSKGFDGRLKVTFWECLHDWMQAMNGKLDVVETRDRSKANIICQWKTPVDYYQQFQGAKVLPAARPRLPRIGEATLRLKKNGRAETIQAAVINVYAHAGSGMRLIDDNVLWNVCMHELGHALGIRKHLTYPNDVMYSWCNESMPNTELTDRDKSAMCNIYLNHPINQRAYDKFIGMRAYCKRLRPVHVNDDEDIIGITSQSALPFQMDALESH